VFKTLLEVFRYLGFVSFAAAHTCKTNQTRESEPTPIHATAIACCVSASRVVVSYAVPRHASVVCVQSASSAYSVIAVCACSCTEVVRAVHCGCASASTRRSLRCYGIISVSCRHGVTACCRRRDGYTAYEDGCQGYAA
jgi:hypothetical protein